MPQNIWIRYCARMPHLPTIGWVVVTLSVLWLFVRIIVRRLDDQRQRKREQRMAKLLEEREALLAEHKTISQTQEESEERKSR